MEEKIKVCPICQNQSSGKYCQECGTPLVDSPIRKGDNLKQEISPSDVGLTLLVDCCSKTLATALGNGYDESILYYNPRNNEYSIHTYNQPVGQKEVHKAYRTTKEFAQEVMAYIDESEIIKYKDNKGFGLCGGDIIVKFVKDGQVIRISAANMSGASLKPLKNIRHFLDSGIKEENKL